MPKPPRTIIVVDDDPDDRLMITMAIKKRCDGVLVETCNDGEELLDRLYGRGRYAGQKVVKPDLVTLDLNMPLVTGQEALRIMKEDPELKQIPVVVLTTSASDADASAAYHEGSNAFMTKPLSYEAFLDAVSNMCSFWFGLAKLPE